MEDDRIFDPADATFANMWAQLPPDQKEKFKRYGDYMYGNLEADLAAIEKLAAEMEQEQQEHQEKKTNHPQ